MSEKRIYREKNLTRISSPEQLNDYLKITRPAVWAVLAAVILLLVGILIWGSSAYIGSSVNGIAKVSEGWMTVYFEDDSFAKNVQEGMQVTVGDTKCTISSVGQDPEGKIFAQAETVLDDGQYKASVTYKQTQVLSLLFNNN